LTTCSICGHQNAFDANFCSQCAGKLSGAATPVDPGAARPAYSPFASPSPYSSEPPRSQNATTILVLGILSLVVCGVLGPIAWHMGHGEIQRIRAGLVSSQDHGMVNAGYICGIIASVLMMVTVLFILVAFAIPFGL
jgi:hypothetical protein